MKLKKLTLGMTKQVFSDNIPEARPIRYVYEGKDWIGFFYFKNHEWWFAPIDRHMNASDLSIRHMQILSDFAQHLNKYEDDTYTSKDSTHRNRLDKFDYKKMMTTHQIYEKIYDECEKEKITMPEINCMFRTLELAKKFTHFIRKETLPEKRRNKS